MYKELSVDLRKNQRKTFEETHRDLLALLLESEGRPTYYELLYIPGIVEEEDGTTHLNGWFADASGKPLNIARDASESLKRQNPVQAEVVKNVYLKEASALDWLAGWCRNGKEEDSLWFSPVRQGVYETSRITKIKKKEKDGALWLEKWAMIWKVDGDECVAVAKSISESNGGHPQISDDPEDLRQKPIPLVIPEGQEWIPFLGGFIKTLPALSLIESGEAMALQKEATKHGREITQIVYPYIPLIRTRRDAVLLGAVMERQARRRGHNNVAKGLGCPGISNTEALEGLQGSYDTLHKLDKNSVVTTVKTKERKHVKKCGACGAEIEAEIEEGYLCPHCGGTYLGC